jgi:signal transduction histidine kinase
MRIQSQRMLQIVEDLLTLSRLESHEELQRERVGCAPCSRRSSARPRR